MILSQWMNNREHSSVAARCLAYLGNIYPTIWREFLQSQNEQSSTSTSIHLQWILTIISMIPKRIAVIRTTVQSVNALQATNQPYLGYDTRDQHDYLLSGYEDYDTMQQSNQAHKEEQIENILIYLLILTQIFHFPSVVLQHTIQIQRETSISSSQIQKLTIENENEMNKAKHIINECIHCVEELIALCYDEHLGHDSIYQYCFQAIILINQQFLMIHEEYHQSTEVKQSFI